MSTTTPVASSGRTARTGFVFAICAINSLVFTLSALLAPAYGWLWADLAGGGKLTLTVFQIASCFGVVGIVAAIVLAGFLQKTGSAGGAAAGRAIRAAEAPT